VAFTLRRNIVWTLFGNGIYAICQWGTLIVLAQFGGTDIVGRFAVALAITAPVTIFFRLALRQVLVTDAKEIHGFNDYLAVRLFAVVFGWLVILSIVMVGDYTVESVAVILAVGLYKVFESISEIFYGLSQRHERLDLVARSQMLRGVLGFAVLALSFYLTGRLLTAVLGVAATWAAVLLFYDLPTSKRWWKKSEIFSFFKSLQDYGNLKQLWQLVLLSLPLGLATTLVSLNTNIPRYFIEQFFGEVALGVFAAMAYLVAAGGMVISAVGQAASPRLANYFAMGNKRAFWGLLTKTLLIGLALGGTGMLMAIYFGREILTLLYGDAFAQNLDTFIWMMMAATISYLASFLGYGMTAKRIFKAQVWIFSAVIAVNTLGCFLLVSEYGITGAVWGWSCALFIQFSLSLWLNVRGGE